MLLQVATGAAEEGRTAVDANTRILKQLLQHDIHYVIPPFQRPYVWNQEDQWEPLWQDIRNTAERYLDIYESLDTEDEDDRKAQAEMLAGSHFLGAVVLQQLPTPSTHVDTRSIIDGQQRMTTLQLCLYAAHNALRDLGYEGAAARLGRLVRNPEASGDQEFKLKPSLLDIDAYRAVMSDPHSAPEDSRVFEAHEFFYLQIRDWIESAESQERATLLIQGLQTALLGLLELVVIDLGPNDDPYVIFETLNARGTPLIASDLIKNLVLQTAHEQGVDPNRLHRERWSLLEDEWWREEVAQGRLRRPRIDVFLNYWLIAMTAEEVPSHSVFDRFRRLVASSEQKIGDVVDEVISYAEVYRSWDSVDPWSPEGTFMYRWRIMDAGVATPFLLSIWHRLGVGRELYESLAILESYLVRRMISRLTTKDYNRLFLELLSQVVDSEDPVPETMGRYLGGSDAESRKWPTNAEVTDALLHVPLYRALTRGRLRMVLEAIEDSMRTSKTEVEFVSRGKLTIEHVLPQGWRTGWPHPLGDDPEEAAIERDRTLHTIGNLTLVTKALNPALSNAPWRVKRDELQKHGVLLLNSELLRDHDDDWFLEDQIRERGRVLARRICEIWPRSLGPIHDELG